MKRRKKKREGLLFIYVRGSKLQQIFLNKINSASFIDVWHRTVKANLVIKYAQTAVFNPPEA